MDLKVPEKEYEELVRKATTLDRLEKVLRDLTYEERNHNRAGILADSLLWLINDIRRQME